MDADLFSPVDTAALLAIRAVIANCKVTPAEVQALFGASGLLQAARAGASSLEAASVAHG